MVLSIKKPELLIVTDNQGNVSYGGKQSWYHSEWAVEAGCGATCGSNILAYLGLTRECFRPLYHPTGMGKESFLSHMNEVYQAIKPGLLGVNRVAMFVNGIDKFAKSRGIDLKCHILSVDFWTKQKRTREKLIDFVQMAIKLDSPIAFLVLSKGKEIQLSSWHWVTIIGVDIDKEHVYAHALDNGKKIKFDLQLWFLSTRMHGGLIYFEQKSG